ncbi:MAG: 3-oxoacyl-[acyl-carrier-protein] synthase [Pseudomonadota bacterium]|jgi:nodulation protein E
MRRVVITGAGTVNALAHDVPGTWAAMREGRSGIGPLDLPDADRLGIRIGAQVRGWDAAAHLEPRQAAQADRFAQFALVAAAQAVAQAGPVTGPDCGVVLGTAGGGLATSEESYRAVFAEGKSRVHPLTVPKLMASAAASHVSMAQGITGPVFTVSTACAGSNHAIGLAFQMVRSGMCRAVLAGGAEAMLTFGGVKAWEGLRVLSPTGCRPFSCDRDGMVQGEGAAVFVLEAREAALARGAEVLAEIVGFAMTADAGDLVAPSLDGAVRAMEGALRDAGLAPGDVGYVNAHGTGTAANDRTEAEAIAKVFGGRLPLVSATKAMHGHCIGATGAIELLAVIMALREGVIAPTLGHAGPDAGVALDVVPGMARQAKVEVALSNAFAFGGLNAVLALRRG